MFASEAIWPHETRKLINSFLNLQLDRNFSDNFPLESFMQMFNVFLARQNMHDDKWGKCVFQPYHYRLDG